MAVPHRLVLREGELRYISKPLHHLCVKLLPWNPGESNHATTWWIKGAFLYFSSIIMKHLLSAHISQRCLGFWKAAFSLSLSLFFFNDFKLTEKLQKWFRVLLLYPLPKSTNYLHFSPFVLLFYVLIYICVSYIVLSCSVMVDSLWPHELYLARLLCPWGFSRQEYWSGLPCPPVLYIHVYIICFLKHCQ